MTEPHLHIVNPTYQIINFRSSELPDQYKALVFSKWLRSLRFGNPLFEKIDQDEYFKNYHIFIENLLRKPDSTIRLAVLSDDKDVVLGFSALREDVLDYVHVHRDQRKQGIARKLIPDTITTLTHLTKTAMGILAHSPRYRLMVKDVPIEKNPDIRYFIFNPFA